MNRKSLIAPLALVLMLCPLSLSAAKTPAMAYPATFTSDQLLADFQVFRAALEEGHGGLYHFRSPAEMKRAFADAKSELQKGGSESDLYVVLARVVAEIQDGHTHVSPSRAYMDFMYGHPRLFPLALSFIDGRAFVRQDLSEVAESIIGAELMTINGLKVESLLKEMLQLVSSDGSNTTGKYPALASVSNFSILLQALHGPVSVFGVSLRTDAQSKVREISLAAIDSANQLSRLRERYPDDSETLDLAFPANSSSTAILTIGEFWGDEYPEFVSSAFREIEKRSIENLIVDLRGNGGGEESFGAMLISHLYDRSFRLYEKATVRSPNFRWVKLSNDPWLSFAEDEIVPLEDGDFGVTSKKYPFLDPHDSETPRFSGNLYVLIDGWSFSTTSDVCAFLHANSDAVFIGSETGGNYYGNTSGDSAVLTLPHTKLRVKIPLVHFDVNVSGYEPRDRGLVPNHQVSITPRSLVDGSDPVMEFAFGLIRNTNGVK